MSRSRIAKTLARGAVVSWRDQPTQHDIEALRANIARVRLVIRLRWAVVTALAVFSVVAASVYGFSTDLPVLLSDLRIPAVAFVFVVAYNSMYQLTYRKVANIAFLNQAQLLFDIVVITVLVYYSGGVYSWFSTMYLLFILEAAFILPRPSHVWALAGAAALLYAVVVFGEYSGVLPHVDLPFIQNVLYANLTYVLLRYLWMIAVFGGSATIGLLMMKTIREREAELAGGSFVDDLTGLFNRPYFHRILGVEAQRARRNGRALALLVVDIDRFGETNRTFGVDVGDAILASVADQMRSIVAAGADDAASSSYVACRVGGEELALIVPEVDSEEGKSLAFAERIAQLAEQLRDGIQATRVSGIGVTASIGVALAPDDGQSAEELLDGADRMLGCASAMGGNRVCATWCTPEECSVADDE